MPSARTKHHKSTINIKYLQAQMKKILPLKLQNLGYITYINECWNNRTEKIKLKSIAITKLLKKIGKISKIVSKTSKYSEQKN